MNETPGINYRYQVVNGELYVWPSPRRLGPPQRLNTDSEVLITYARAVWQQRRKALWRLAIIDAVFRHSVRAGWLSDQLARAACDAAFDQLEWHLATPLSNAVAFYSSDIQKLINTVLAEALT